MSDESKGDKVVKKFVLYTVAAVMVIVLGLMVIGVIGLFSN